MIKLWCKSAKHFLRLFCYEVYAPHIYIYALADSYYYKLYCYLLDAL